MMRRYNYQNKWKQLLTPEIVLLLTEIHELKGKYNYFCELGSDSLAGLAEMAKIQSVHFSNKMEGIVTSDERIKKLSLSKANPKNRNEEQIAGYRDVFDAILLNYNGIPVKPNIILQLHRDLYRYDTLTYGGQYRSCNDFETKEVISNKNAWHPHIVNACNASESIESLCEAYNNALASGLVNSLVAIMMFMLDFLCVNPFSCGNAHMSRLLMQLLLCRSGYDIGKYISLEKYIESTVQGYCDALQKSSEGWREGNNDYAPFVKYMLSVILEAYKEFDSYMKTMIESKLSKPERVAEFIENAPGRVTKHEILQKYSDISETTVQRALADLLKNQKITKISGGRYTSYIWNREENNK